MSNLPARFYLNFIEDDRWKYLVTGLKNTLIVAFFAVMIGVAIGCVLALIRTTHDKTGKLGALNVFAKIYLTVIRGTPTTIQVLICYFVLFGPWDVSKLVAASIAFGLNSGAYVAEIFRSGIMSIDRGQSEAGRSLGLNYSKTMQLIIMPQAIKNILPALGNEFIVLLKETSVAGFIALQDLTKGADIIRSRTYDAAMPLFAAALIYLVMVVGLEKLFGMLERRMAKSDYR
ncbi:MAG: amino acid ABC transporter permease [Oscillospiraceae bacterium]